VTVRRLIRLLCAGLLGVAVALALVSCGSSGKGLIPTANAGPLKSDFAAVAQAAQNGEGICTDTEAAIAKTERDFTALPASIDAGLRKALSRGISNLRRRALALCEQQFPLTNTSTSTPTKTTTNTPTTPTTTVTTPTTSTPTTPTTPAETIPTATTPGGGTPAPGSESSPGTESRPGGGTGIGGESGSGAPSAGVPSGSGGPGQEGSK
jgi:hypothetical protein